MDKIHNEKIAVIKKANEMLKELADENSTRSDAVISISMTQDGSDIVIGSHHHGTIMNLVSLVCNIIENASTEGQKHLKDCIIIAVGAELMKKSDNPVISSVINGAVRGIVDPIVLETYMAVPEEECNCPDCIAERADKANKIKNDTSIN